MKYQLPDIMASREPGLYYEKIVKDNNPLVIRHFDVMEFTVEQYLEYLKDIYCLTKEHEGSIYRERSLSYDGGYAHLGKAVPYIIITTAQTKEGAVIDELKIPLEVNGPQIYSITIDVEPTIESNVNEYFKEARELIDTKTGFLGEFILCQLSLLSQYYVTGNYRISDSSSYNTISPSKTKKSYWDDPLVVRARWAKILNRVEFEPPKRTTEKFKLFHNGEPIYIPSHFKEALKDRLKLDLPMVYEIMPGVNPDRSIWDEDRDITKSVFDKLVEDYVKKEGQL
ncbi:hypothetical protein A7C00_000186 [Shigella flexneri]|nr:hypothetical protein [Salmonella enterica subsp. enterica serovar Enteritidis]EFZ6456972.1 hypothetical protein [Shigella flexneri]